MGLSSSCNAAHQSQHFLSSVFLPRYSFSVSVLTVKCFSQNRSGVSQILLHWYMLASKMRLVAAFLFFLVSNAMLAK